MAYSSNGIIKLSNGYESYSDASASACFLAERVLKGISDSNFNPGQQAIVENTRFDADIQLYYIKIYEGPIAYISSKVQSYYFKINCPYPEAISETLKQLEDDIKDVIYKIHEYEDSYEIGYGIEELDQINSENKSYIDSKFGYWI